MLMSDVLKKENNFTYLLKLYLACATDENNNNNKSTTDDKERERGFVFKSLARMAIGTVFGFCQAAAAQDQQLST